MKRIAILMLMVAALFAAQGQGIQTTIGTQSKDFNLAQASEVITIGEHDGLTLLATRRFTVVLGNYLPRECMVMAVDKNLNKVRSIELADTKGDDIEAATLHEGKVYLLLAHQDRNEASFRRYVVDAATMQPIGEPTTVYRYEKVRKDDLYHWIAQSPDRNLTGLVHIVTNRKTDGYSAVQIMLDETMKEEWRREYPIQSMSDLLVTNDGQMVTLGKSADRKKTASTLYISMLDDENAIDLHKDVDVMVSDMKLVNCLENGKVLAVGIGIDPQEHKQVKYFGLSADTRSDKVDVSYQNLTDEENSVFVNASQGNRAYKVGIDYLQLRHCKATAQGGVGTIQCRWAIERCDKNGSCSVTYYMMGSVVFAIDEDSRISWHHAVRSNYKEPASAALICNSLCVEGDRVYFLQSEHAKWPATYDITKSVKMLNPKRGTKNIGIYCFDANGAVTKQVKTLDEKTILAGSMERLGDSYIGFLTKGNSTSLITMKF